MAVPVFFMDARSRSEGTNSLSKFRALLARASEALPDAIRAGDLCAIKLHFGEAGNDTYIGPALARAAADLARSKGAKPFFTDTNTLYRGSRSNAVDHLATAIAHGFVPETCGAPVLIADGLKGSDWREVPLPAVCKRLKVALMAGGILDADSMIVLSHFKGHEMAGYGGAVKNLAMGCAPPAGKREQHCIRFEVRQGKCVSCGRCVPVCPADAITLPEGGKASIDRARCIGCGECQTVCAPHAIGMNWEVGLDEFTEKMTEYALGALHGKSGRVLYLNVVRDVVPHCDCVPWSDVPVVPDIGYLASTDPVALDKASHDLVTAAPVWPGSALDGKAGPGDEKFRILYPDSKPDLQAYHGEAIGLGSRDYELVRL